MPKIKVQKRKVKSKGRKYEQFWVALPKTLVESMKIEKGNELEVFVERGDIILKRE
jgi:bifunctional DNA-binding transcriptional regulator/antitoxin component of YhaV-PrlF toxin-antitoxin module